MTRRNSNHITGRLKPGRHLEHGFPRIADRRPPNIARRSWELLIYGAVRAERRWSWDEYRGLPREAIRADLHCPPAGSLRNTIWHGVSLDVLLEGGEPLADFAHVECGGGHATDLALRDLIHGKAWVVDVFEGKPLAPEHGGPARLLVPHLDFSQS